MSLTLVTAPTVEPITLQEAKDHLRVDGATDDALISALIQAARQHIDGRDGWLGRALMTQTWDYTLDEFPDTDYIPLPLAPVQSITSITYTDTNGASQTFSSANYALGADLAWQPRVNLGYGLSWASTRGVPDAVKVRFVAGYANAADVPGPIKAALLLTVGELYEQREESVIGPTVARVPFGVDYLLAPYRRTLV